MIGQIVVFGLTAFGVVVSPFRPYWAILVYVFFAIIRPNPMFPGALPSWPFSEIVVAAAAVGFVLQGFGDWKLGKGKWAFWGVLFYLAWDLLSAAKAPFWTVGWEHFLSQIRIFIPCLMAILLARSLTDAKLLAWTIALGEGAVALRFNEYYYLRDLGWYLVDVGFSRKDNNLWTIDMVIGAVFCFFLVLAARRIWMKAAPAVLGMLCISAVMFLYSRGGQLALLTAGLVMVAFLPKKPKYIAMFLAAAVVIAALAGPSVIDEFKTIFVESSERDASSESRLQLWAAMIEVSRQRPLLGVGPNHFPLVAPSLGWTTEKEGHNLWLQWAAELGFPAVIAMLVFYLSTVPQLWKTRHMDDASAREEERWMKLLAGATTCSIAAFVVGSQFISIDLLEAPVFVGTLAVILVKILGAQEAENEAGARGRDLFYKRVPASRTRPQNRVAGQARENRT